MKYRALMFLIVATVTACQSALNGTGTGGGEGSSTGGTSGGSGSTTKRDDCVADELAGSRTAELQFAGTETSLKTIATSFDANGALTQYDGSACAVSPSEPIARPGCAQYYDCGTCKIGMSVEHIDGLPNKSEQWVLIAISAAGCEKYAGNFKVGPYTGAPFSSSSSSGESSSSSSSSSGTTSCGSCESCYSGCNTSCDGYPGSCSTNCFKGCDKCCSL